MKNEVEIQLLTEPCNDYYYNLDYSTDGINWHSALRGGYKTKKSIIKRIDWLKKEWPGLSEVTRWRVVQVRG